MRAPAFLAAALAATLCSCAVGTPGPATDVTHVGATLNGTVYSSLEGDTTWWFDLGDTRVVRHQHAGARGRYRGRRAAPGVGDVYGLDPATTYHFRICVRDARRSRRGPSAARTARSRPWPNRRSSPAKAPSCRLDGEPYRFTGLNIYNANSGG